MTTESPKLLDQLRAAIRVKHYSRRTEDTYVNWVKRYICFHNKRHPKDMGAPEIAAFLTDLAANGNVVNIKLESPQIIGLKSPLINA